MNDAARRAGENFQPVKPSTISDADYDRLSPIERVAYARQASAAAGDLATAPPATTPEKPGGIAGNTGTADIALISPVEGDQSPKVRIGELLPATRLNCLNGGAAASAISLPKRRKL
jgi:hypothetical protein